MELRDFEAEKEWPFCVELMCRTEGDPLKIYDARLWVGMNVV